MARVPLQGFVGGSNALPSTRTNLEQAINSYPELADAGTPTARWWQRPTPGFTTDGFLALAACRNGVVALHAEEGRAFAVAGLKFYEMHAYLNPTLRGTLVVDAGTRKAYISSNGVGRQLFIVAGGKGYIHNLDTNVFAQITDPQFPTTVIWGGYADGYFLAIGENSVTASYSTLNDGTAWAAADVVTKSRTTDRILTGATDHGELLLFGDKTIESYVNTGDLRSPWVSRPTPIETGIGAPDSLAKGKEHLFWVAGSERGGRTVVAASGLSIVTIGNQAVHAALAAAEAPELAWGWFYEYEAHGFYVLRFDDQTWVYDTLTKLWHERRSWNATTGEFEAYVGQCHAYAFGHHLIGLRTTDPDFPTLAIVGRLVDRHPYEQIGITRSVQIRRRRRTPYVVDGMRMLVHDSLELDCDDAQSETEQFVTLRYSDDLGVTWSEPRPARIAPTGDSGSRIFWRGLGSSRRRVYEVTIDSPGWCGLSGAQLDLRGGLR
jgi:hypothetical protein